VIVLAIDPGRRKCGLAVCGTHGVLLHEIVARAALRDRVRAVAARHAPAVILIGDRSVGRHLAAALAEVGVAATLVDEAHTTLQARARYWKDHPPRGWRRWLPAGLLVPDRPYDDYVAVLLAERYLAREVGTRPGDVENRR